MLYLMFISPTGNVVGLNATVNTVRAVLTAYSHAEALLPWEWLDHAAHT